jgi:hypothetical protein
MNTLAIDSSALKATGIQVTDQALVVSMADGRTVSAPLVWYPRLLNGTPAERGNHRIIGDGEGFHWPDLDEDISVEGILAGRSSGECAESLQAWLASRSATAIDS